MGCCTPACLRSPAEDRWAVWATYVAMFLYMHALFFLSFVSRCAWAAPLLLLSLLLSCRFRVLGNGTASDKAPTQRGDRNDSPRQQQQQQQQREMDPITTTTRTRRMSTTVTDALRGLSAAIFPSARAQRGSRRPPYHGASEDSVDQETTLHIEVVADGDSAADSNSDPHARAEYRALHNNSSNSSSGAYSRNAPAALTQQGITAPIPPIAVVWAVGVWGLLYTVACVVLNAVAAHTRVLDNITGTATTRGTPAARALLEALLGLAAVGDEAHDSAATRREQLVSVVALGCALCSASAVLIAVSRLRQLTPLRVDHSRHRPHAAFRICLAALAALAAALYPSYDFLPVLIVPHMAVVFSFVVVPPALGKSTNCDLDDGDDADDFATLRKCGVPVAAAMTLITRAIAIAAGTLLVVCLLSQTALIGVVGVTRDAVTYGGPWAIGWYIRPGHWTGDAVRKLFQLLFLTYTVALCCFRLCWNVCMSSEEAEMGQIATHQQQQQRAAEARARRRGETNRLVRVLRMCGRFCAANVIWAIVIFLSIVCFAILDFVSCLLLLSGMFCFLSPTPRYLTESIVPAIFYGVLSVFIVLEYIGVNLVALQKPMFMGNVEGSCSDDNTNTPCAAVRCVVLLVELFAASLWVLVNTLEKRRRRKAVFTMVSHYGQHTHTHERSNAFIRSAWRLFTTSARADLEDATVGPSGDILVARTVIKAAKLRQICTCMETYLSQPQLTLLRARGAAFARFCDPETGLVDYSRFAGDDGLLNAEWEGCDGYYDDSAQRRIWRSVTGGEQCVVPLLGLMEAEQLVRDAENVDGDNGAVPAQRQGLSRAPMPNQTQGPAAGDDDGEDSAERECRHLQRRLRYSLQDALDAAPQSPASATTAPEHREMAEMEDEEGANENRLPVGDGEEGHERSSGGPTTDVNGSGGVNVAFLLSAGSPGNDAMSFMDYLVLLRELDAYRGVSTRPVLVHLNLMLRVFLLAVGDILLLVMFAATMTVEYMDALNAVYLVFFLVRVWGSSLAIAVDTKRKLAERQDGGKTAWPAHGKSTFSVFCSWWRIILVFYTMVYVILMVVFMMLRNTYGAAFRLEDKQSSLALVGVLNERNPFTMLTYIILLVLSMLEGMFQEFDEIGDVIKLRQLLLVLEWERFVGDQHLFFSWLSQGVALFFLVVLLVVMAVAAPRSIFIAGFAALLVLTLVVSIATRSKRKYKKEEARAPDATIPLAATTPAGEASANGTPSLSSESPAHSRAFFGVTIALAVYVNAVLLICAAYQFPKANQAVLDLLLTVKSCASAASLPDCALQVGLYPVGYFGSSTVFCALLPWYVAVGLVCRLCREASLSVSFDRDGRSKKRSQVASVAVNGGSGGDQVPVPHQHQAPFGVEDVSAGSGTSLMRDTTSSGGLPYLFCEVTSTGADGCRGDGVADEACSPPHVNASVLTEPIYQSEWESPNRSNTMRPQGELDGDAPQLCDSPALFRTPFTAYVRAIHQEELARDREAGVFRPASDYLSTHAKHRFTFTGRMVAAATDTLHGLCVALLLLRRLGTHTYIPLACVWATQIYACCTQLNLIGSCYALLFLLDGLVCVSIETRSDWWGKVLRFVDPKGLLLVVVALVHMAMKYAYPFFFVRPIHLSSDSLTYIGLGEDTNKLSSLWPPILVCCAALIYLLSHRQPLSPSAAAASPTVQDRHLNELSFLSGGSDVVAVPHNNTGGGGGVTGGVELPPQSQRLGRFPSSLQEHATPVMQTLGDLPTFVRTPQPAIPRSMHHANSPPQLRTGSGHGGCGDFSPLSTPPDRHDMQNIPTTPQQQQSWFVSQLCTALWYLTSGPFMRETLFEQITLVLCILLAIAIDTVLGFIVLAYLAGLVICGRVWLATRTAVAVTFEVALSLVFAVAYVFLVGFPNGVLNDVAILHRGGAEPTQLFFFLGGHVPVPQVVMLLVCLMLHRLTRLYMPRTRATLPTYRGFTELFQVLGEQKRQVRLRKNRTESRSLSYDMGETAQMDHILHLPTTGYDRVRDPKNVMDVVVGFFVVLIPAAALGFIAGIVLSSIMGVIQVVLTLFVLSFRRRLSWHWHYVWVGYIAFLMIFSFLQQLCVHLPLESVESVYASSPALSVMGLAAWPTNHLILEAVTLWLAIVALRIANELFSADYLAGLFAHSRTASRRHRLMLRFMQSRHDKEVRKADEQEAALRLKLHQLAQERCLYGGGRRMHTPAPSPPHSSPWQPTVVSPLTTAKESPRGSAWPLHFYPSDDGRANFMGSSDDQPPLPRGSGAAVPFGTTEDTQTFFPLHEDRRGSAPGVLLYRAAAVDDSLTEARQPLPLPPRRPQGRNRPTTPTMRVSLSTEKSFQFFEERDDGDGRGDVCLSSWGIPDDSRDIGNSSSVDEAERTLGHRTLPPHTSRERNAPRGASPRPDMRESANSMAASSNGMVPSSTNAKGILKRLLRSLTGLVRRLIRHMDSRSLRGEKVERKRRKQISPGTAAQEEPGLLQDFGSSLVAYLRTHSSYLCFFTMALHYALTGTVLDLLLSLSAFTYGLLMLPPAAGAHYWGGVLAYLVLSIMVKSVLQVFILYDGPAERAFDMSTKGMRTIDALVLCLGQISPEVKASVILRDVIMTFVVFVTVLLHREVCLDYGIYRSQRSMAIQHSLNADPTTAGDTTSEENEEGMGYEQRTDTTANDGANAGHTHGPDAKWQLTDDGSWCPTPRQLLSNVYRRRGAGSDYYTSQFLFDVATIAAFLWAYPPLARSSGEGRNILFSVADNHVPGPFLVIILGLVLLMCVERAIYVTHCTTAKIVLHMALAVFYHAIFLLWRVVFSPSFGGGLLSPLSRSEVTAPAAAAIALFSMKCASLWVSALQIREGYPLYRSHDPFTTSPNFFHWLGFMTFRTVPFLFELRLFLDWTFSRTALKVQQWMLLEDIHYWVYRRYVDMSDLHWTSRKKGRRFPWLVKVYQGLIGCAAILLVVFFPLFLYSSFDTKMGRNSVVQWNRHIAFEHGANFYTAQGQQMDGVSREQILASTWSAVPRARTEGFGVVGSLQQLNFPTCSATRWSISTPALADVKDSLRGAFLDAASPFSLLITDMIEREVDEVMSGSSRGSFRTLVRNKAYTLPADSAAQMYNTIVAFEDYRASATGPGGGDAGATFSGAWVPLPHFLNPLITNAASSVIGESYAELSCRMQLQASFRSGGDGQAYWCVECDEQAQPRHRQTIEAAASDTDESGPMFTVVSSTDVPVLSSSLYFLPSVGVIALYTTFVLAISSIVRNAVSGDAHRIVLMQVANPTPLAELLRYIYLARSSAAAPRSRGNNARGAPTTSAMLSASLASSETTNSLLLEQQLFLELVDLLRTPERLIRISGLRVEDYDEDGAYEHALYLVSQRPFGRAGTHPYAGV